MDNKYAPEMVVKTELPLFHVMKDNILWPFNMWALFMKDTIGNTWASVGIS